MSLSFRKLFYSIATLFVLFAILYLARTILIPIGFALILAFILLPIVKRFESWRMSKTIAAFLSIFTVAIIFGVIIFFFSIQIRKFSNEFPNFQLKMFAMFDELTNYLNDHARFVPYLKQDELYNRVSDWLMDSSGSFLQQSFSGTTYFLAGLLVTTIFTFLLLIYRNGLTNAFLSMANEDKRVKILKMLKSIQHVGQQYLSGMLIVITIIGFANSIGLWIIGIDNPFLFGFLGALLSIIPYVGTSTGGIIPILYAVVFHDSLWMALSIGILFWAVQLISDNFLSPKIIGGGMRINALAAILSLIVGASMWGIAGMILFLPFTAMLKVVCEEYTELKPIALLIEDQNHHNEGAPRNFLGRWIAGLKSRLSSKR